MLKLIAVILCSFPVSAVCQKGDAIDSFKRAVIEDEYKKKSFHFVTDVPGNIWQISKQPFKKNNLTGLIITAGATALLIPLDQDITDELKKFSYRIKLYPQTNYKVPLKLGDTKILKIPQNLNTAFYQLGEGGTSMLVAGGLFIYGKIKKDKQAINTAGDLTETFITMGVATQIIKRISGRESPFKATQPGGSWKPFPSLHNYQSNTSRYDAFPSGHLATMMATVTTLTLNYPKNKWIKPVGYTLMCVSSWAMINTEVHWISDYPLALALGYVAAKITYKKNHPKKKY